MRDNCIPGNPNATKEKANPRKGGRKTHRRRGMGKKTPKMNGERAIREEMISCLRKRITQRAFSRDVETSGTEETSSWEKRTNNLPNGEFRWNF
ncbi:hypothetical protein J1N35_042513 [Gossypium stocksii]|uniref:Uncharacterized protein n=1 Tax=Gossypium stocksii TaxID=47602 RepID=A0A9D3U5N4_9ROSI|nr:hypothetical protein J1N35_042513 [Gossypium stocksii]